MCVDTSRAAIPASEHAAHVQEIERAIGKPFTSIEVASTRCFSDKQQSDEYRRQIESGPSSSAPGDSSKGALLSY
jgi:hypothetical protein